MSFVVPVDGEPVFGKLRLVADVRDAFGIDRVEFRADGQLVGTATSAPYAVSWDAPAPGHNVTLSVEAFDVTGQSASMQIHVYAPDQYPTIALASPQDGAQVHSVLTLQALASDDVHVAKVEYYVDGQLICRTAAGDGCSWDSLQVPAGTRHSAYAIAVDSKGQRTASDTHRFTVEDTPPAIALTSPTGVMTVGGRVQLVVNATDDEAVQRVQFLVDGDLIGTLTQPPYQVWWDTTAFTNGVAHQVQAIAFDRRGNQASAATTIVVENGPQPLTFTSPDVENAILCGQATIAVAVQPTSLIDSIYFAAHDPSSGATLSLGRVQAPYQVSWDTQPLPNGRYFIVAAGYAGGVLSAETTAWVDVENQNPSMSCVPDTGP